jgi:hypothetical protein
MFTSSRTTRESINKFDVEKSDRVEGLLPVVPGAMASCCGENQAVGLYAAWITAVRDQDLQQIVTFLKAHNMGIEKR